MELAYNDVMSMRNEDLRRAVGYYVMGWATTMRRGQEFWIEKETGNSLYRVENWKPDIFLDHAMNILRTLEENEREILFSVSRAGSTMKTLKWRVTFRECKGAQRHYYLESESITDGICKCSLLAALEIRVGV